MQFHYFLPLLIAFFSSTTYGAGYLSSNNRNYRRSHSLRYYGGRDSSIHHKSNQEFKFMYNQASNCLSLKRRRYKESKRRTTTKNSPIKKLDITTFYSDQTKPYEDLIKLYPAIAKEFTQEKIFTSFTQTKYMLVIQLLKGLWKIFPSQRIKGYYYVPIGVKNANLVYLVCQEIDYLKQLHYVELIEEDKIHQNISKEFAPFPFHLLPTNQAKRVKEGQPIYFNDQIRVFASLSYLPKKKHQKSNNAMCLKVVRKKQERQVVVESFFYTEERQPAFVMKMPAVIKNGRVTCASKFFIFVENNSQFYKPKYVIIKKVNCKKDLANHRFNKILLIDKLGKIITRNYQYLSGLPSQNRASIKPLQYSGNHLYGHLPMHPTGVPYNMTDYYLFGNLVVHYPDGSRNYHNNGYGLCNPYSSYIDSCKKKMIQYPTDTWLEQTLNWDVKQ